MFRTQLYTASPLSSSMTNSRRDFIKTVSVVAATGAIGTRGLGSVDRLFAAAQPSVGDPTYRELTQVALDAARAAGASYSDIRISARRSQGVRTRENQLQGVNDSDTLGFGIRALANGAWGFAASNILTKDVVAQVARDAVAIAKANSTVQLKPIILAPTSVATGEWKSPIKIDPFDVPIGEKVDLLADRDVERVDLDRALPFAGRNRSRRKDDRFELDRAVGLGDCHRVACDLCDHVLCKDVACREAPGSVCQRANAKAQSVAVVYALQLIFTSSHALRSARGDPNVGVAGTGGACCIESDLSQLTIGGVAHRRLGGGEESIDRTESTGTDGTCGCDNGDRLDEVAAGIRH